MITLISWYFQATFIQSGFQRLRFRTQVKTSRYSSFLWSDWDIHYLGFNLIIQHKSTTAPLFCSDEIAGCSLQMNYNELKSVMCIRPYRTSPKHNNEIHVLNQIVGPKYLQMEQFISSREICENWTISSFWPFWRSSASTLVSEKEQGVATTDELLLSFYKSIFAQNYLKLDSTQAQIRDLVWRKEDKMRAWVICCVLAQSGFTYKGRLGRWHGTRDRWLAAKQGRSNFAALVLMTRNIKMPDEWYELNWQTAMQY